MGPLLPVTMENRLEIIVLVSQIHQREWVPFIGPSFTLISAHLKEWQLISDIRYSEIIY